MGKADAKPITKILRQVVGAEVQEEPAAPEPDPVTEEEEVVEETEEPAAEEELAAEEPDVDEEEDEEPETPEPKTYDAAYVKQLREEAKKHRLAKRDADKKLAALEKKQAAEKKAAERAKMDEVERLKADLKEKEDMLNQAQRAVLIQAKESAVVKKAMQMGFIDPSDAVIMLGTSLDDLELSDDGEVDDVEVEEQLTELKERRPYLVKQESTEVKDMSKRVVMEADRKAEESKRKASKPRSKEEEQDQALTNEILEANANRDGGKAFQAYVRRHMLRSKTQDGAWRGFKSQ